MKSKSGLWWVCLLWVAIVGQAYSYPIVPCQMMTNHDTQMSHDKVESSSQVMDHAMMDHGKMDHTQMLHDMDTSTQTVNNTDDCCGSDCQCPANACTAYSFITAGMWGSTTNLVDDKVVTMDVELQPGSKNALFRPPISA